MPEPSCPIKMDYRERDSGIGEILKEKYQFDVTIESLKTGDYILQDEIVIERKTSLDFIRSILDGRLFKQAWQMKQMFDDTAIVVEGKDLYQTSVGIHPHAVKGALTSILLEWQMPVLFSEDAEDTALFLWLLSTQRVKRANELSLRPGRRPKRVRKRQLYLLQGLPHVGPWLASHLLSHFGSVEKVMTASEEDLRQIPRLGKVKAKKIREIVSNHVYPTGAVPILEESNGRD